ncbi:ATP dependent DNA ligase family protein [Mycobacterium xenopi 3993]|nr:ATP dependent DNA ligase family protein [Mycobacterium xenopi 3993]
MGIPADGGLHFAGRVGTGFTERELTRLKKTLAPLQTGESRSTHPFPLVTPRV